MVKTGYARSPEQNQGKQALLATNAGFSPIKPNILWKKPVSWCEKMTTFASSQGEALGREGKGIFQRTGDSDLMVTVNKNGAGPIMFE